MKRMVCAALAALLAVMAPAVASAADDAFKALYTAEWQWRDAELGPFDERAPLRDHLSKVDAATQAARLAYWRDVAKKLDAIDRHALSDREKTNYDVYKPQIAALIANQTFKTYQAPANSDSSFWADLAYTADRSFKTAADYRAWIAQMRDLPRFFAENVTNMRAGLKRGFTPPQVTLQGRDTTIAAIVKAKPEDTFFYKPFRVMPSAIPAAEQAALRAAAVAAIVEAVQPAHAKLLTFWNTAYVPRARKTLAAYDLPGGKVFYAAQILEYTTLDTSPEDIHQIGLIEVAKLRAAMEAVMRKTGFTGDFPAFLHYLRTDPQFTAKSKQEILERAAWIAKEFDRVAPRYFGLLPRRRFAIIPMADDIAPFSTSGRGGPGIFMLNTFDPPHRPLFALTALTLHESAPGHAFQMSLAMEDASLPDFRRHSFISAYGEGWALYCEWLGREMGLYATDYDLFGMLGYQIWRAARLVVDTGVHAKGWSRAQAVQYLHDNTALSDHEIETEVDRYIGWPGQALSYYLGELVFKKLRGKAERQLGAAFNIRAFHDTVLSLGSVPLPVLENRIDGFIDAGGKGPYPDLE